VPASASDDVTDACAGAGVDPAESHLLNNEPGPPRQSCPLAAVAVLTALAARVFIPWS
jgi:hypothetical protein